MFSVSDFNFIVMLILGSLKTLTDLNATETRSQILISLSRLNLAVVFKNLNITAKKNSVFTLPKVVVSCAINLNLFIAAFFYLMCNKNKCYHNLAGSYRAIATHTCLSLLHMKPELDVALVATDDQTDVNN